MAHLLEFIEVKRYQSFVGIRIAPGEATPRTFHIAFVLDVSGSMDGDRLETVQRTLRLFADQMDAEDRVSIITYCSKAHVLANKVGKDDLIQHTNSLTALGGTNMEAGLMALLDLDLASVDAVFLLTDGEVNQGISSVRGLESLVRRIARTIPVYTLGYGETHNARLLQAIAVATRASYTFAESNEMIPSVVGSILVAMREEVAKAVTLEWETVAGPEGAEVECWEAGAVKGSRSFCVGSLIANKPQWIVFRCNGSMRKLTISATDHPSAEIPLPTSQEDDTVVLEQWYRAEAVRVFSEIQEEPPMKGLATLQVLEDDILSSCVAERPLILRICAQIAEERALLDRAAKAANTNGGPMWVVGGGSCEAAIARFASHMTALATQRGGEIPEFHSPSQRQVSNAMVHSFVTGDPQT